MYVHGYAYDQAVGQCRCLVLIRNDMREVLTSQLSRYRVWLEKMDKAREVFVRDVFLADEFPQDLLRDRAEPFDLVASLADSGTLKEGG